MRLLVYENVIETLEYLHDRNIMISLLTTKNQDQADKIINHFGLRKYFSVIMGRRNGIPIKPAPDFLIRICKETAVPLENTLMVGDTELDIQCGKNAGAVTCAVTYGFRTKEALMVENPDFIVSDIQEIIKIIE